jgi:hypothetical protein
LLGNLVVGGRFKNGHCELGVFKLTGASAPLSQLGGVCPALLLNAGSQYATWHSAIHRLLGVCHGTQP